MSIDRLSERIRIQLTERRAIAFATITVKRVDPSADRRRFAGRVRIDGQQLGYLVGGEPRTFDVEPGEHTITVYFGRKPAIISSRRPAMSTASVSLGAGERAEFACGIRPEVARQWAKVRRAVAFRVTVCVAAIELVYWLITPNLRPAVALAVFYLPVPGSLIPWCYRLVSPVLSVLWFVLLASWMVGRSTHLRRDESYEELLRRIGSPYYIERWASVGINENRADRSNHCEETASP